MCITHDNQKVEQHSSDGLYYLDMQPTKRPLGVVGVHISAGHTFGSKHDFHHVIDIHITSTSPSIPH